MEETTPEQNTFRQTNISKTKPSTQTLFNDIYRPNEMERNEENETNFLYTIIYRGVAPTNGPSLTI